MGTLANYPAVEVNPKVVHVAGSFAPNGANPVDATSRKGKLGFSVARTGVGVFLLTLAGGKYAALLSSALSVQLAAFADTSLQIGAVDLSAKTIEIRVNTAGVAADIAANAGNRINFHFQLLDTTQQGS